MAKNTKPDQLKKIGLRFLLSKFSAAHPAVAPVAAIILTVLGGMAQTGNVNTQQQQADQSESIAYLLLDIMQENQALKERIRKLEQEKAQ